MGQIVHITVLRISFASTRQLRSRFGMLWSLELIHTLFLLAKRMVHKASTILWHTITYTHPHASISFKLICFSIDIATNFGGGCTKWGINTQFRKIKTDALLISQAVTKGEDPMTVQVGENGRSQKGVVRLSWASHHSTCTNSTFSFRLQYARYLQILGWCLYS